MSGVVAVAAAFVVIVVVVFVLFVERMSLLLYNVFCCLFCQKIWFGAVFNAARKTNHKTSKNKKKICLTLPAMTKSVVPEKEWSSYYFGLHGTRDSPVTFLFCLCLLCLSLFISLSSLLASLLSSPVSSLASRF